jgi:hypothetical protein
MELNRLSPLRGAGQPNVDFANDIIRNVVLVQEGEAKGHGVWLDSKFINDIAKQGALIDGGVKSRFGHPNMCGNSLGDYLGTYQNFSSRRQLGKMQAIADLHLDRSVADKSPKYDKSLVDYVLQFASDQPNMFGNSIVFRGDQEEREVKENGEKVKKIFMVLVENGFSASDVVDDPAATSGMFSQYNIANQVTEFIQNAEIDINQFDELLNNESFSKFAELLLRNPKISHRILSIVLTNSEIYNEFKTKINGNSIDLDQVAEMFN